MDSSYKFDHGYNISKEMLDKRMMEFSLFLYNNPLLSRKAVDEILEKLNSFISNMFVPFLQNQIKYELKSVNDVAAAYHKAQFILEKNRNIFEKFSTEHSRFQIYEKESFYVPPELFQIGEETIFVARDDGRIEIKMKPVYASFVPLQATLKNVFSSPGVLKEMLDYTSDLSKEKTVLRNIIQGELWLNVYNDESKIVFPLFVYYDEFETGNPLGSHAGEEKLGGVYASLGTLPPHLIAKLENIHLLTIFRSKYWTEFGNEKIFSRVIEECNLLSNEGITVTFEDKTFNIFFHCILILGDNKGLNDICGFSGSFRAKHFCRICTVTHDESLDMTVENPNLIRTVHSYETDAMKNQFKVTGIKERCVFNKIKKFHITQNLTVDVMHDLSEGIGPYTITGILDYFVSNGTLSLKIINNRIETFPYNDTEKANKPRPLFFTQAQGGKKVKLKQSASEMLCLIRYLGLMIGDLIPSDSLHWELYRCLREIVGILTSPQLTRGQIYILQSIIQKHNELYSQLLGNLKPKMHLWLHYCRVMLLNGPVVHYSSIKFERKNRKLKEIKMGTSSNVNLPLTIAIRHQLQMCYIAEFCQPHMQKDVQIGSIDDENAFVALKRILPNINENLKVQTLKDVKIVGKKFSNDTVFVLNISSLGPTFGIIKNIFYSDNTHIYFYVKQFTTLYFNHYFHAYNVHSNSDESDVIVHVDRIPRLPPCLYIVKNNEELVATRFDV